MSPANSIVLYSFRRCPYAIRARLALAYSHIRTELREVDLKQKPIELLELSPKATVPVLVLDKQQVLDESLDIIVWSLKQSDPDNWLQPHLRLTIENLIFENDTVFKRHLDHYKYADRFPEHPQLFYRQHAESFLIKLEQQLNQYTFLITDSISIADIAIFPFIRQFAYVDIHWFNTAAYPNLQRWLSHFLQSLLFQNVMKKQPTWKNSDSIVYL